MTLFEARHIKDELETKDYLVEVLTIYSEKYIFMGESKQDCLDKASKHISHKLAYCNSNEIVFDRIEEYDYYIMTVYIWDKQIEGGLF